MAEDSPDDRDAGFRIIRSVDGRVGYSIGYLWPVGRL